MNLRQSCAERIHRSADRISDDLTDLVKISARVHTSPDVNCPSSDTPESASVCSCGNKTVPMTRAASDPYFRALDGIIELAEPFNRVCAEHRAHGSFLGQRRDTFATLRDQD